MDRNITISLRKLFIGIAVISVLAGLFIGLNMAGGSVPEPSLAMGLFECKVDGGNTYYPVAYGIKSDGTLRIEVKTVPESGVVELDENMEVKNDEMKIKIYEIPPGKWELTDRRTEEKIKPKGE